MEWLNKMNSAIDYIEMNLTEKIDYTQVANIACCSLSRFQNMFLFLTDITISEYIRRRRMALSAKELINSNIKIIDLSFKYGYESPAAFTRSFQSFHKASPSTVRKHGKYFDYPRISFHIKIMGGHFNMETNTNNTTTVYKNIVVKVSYLILEESFKFIGLGNKGMNPFDNIGVFTERYKKTVPNNVHEYTAFGIYTNLPDGNNWDYYFGVQVSTLSTIPDGLTGFDTQTKRFAVMSFGASSMFELVGDANGPGDAMKTAGEFIKDIWLPEHKDIAILNENGECGKVLVDGKIYHTGCFEAYPNNFDDVIEMQFYVPLK